MREAQVLELLFLALEFLDKRGVLCSFILFFFPAADGFAAENDWGMGENHGRRSQVLLDAESGHLRAACFPNGRRTFGKDFRTERYERLGSESSKAILSSDDSARKQG